MLEDVLDIDEIRTVDSVDEVNHLLQDDWQLIGFHAAPKVEGSGVGAPTTIFIMARFSEEDYDEDLDDSDLALETYEPLPS